MVSLLTVFEETNTLSKPLCLETQGTEGQTSYLHTNTTEKEAVQLLFSNFSLCTLCPRLCLSPVSVLVLVLDTTAQLIPFSSSLCFPFCGLLQERAGRKERLKLKNSLQAKKLWYLVLTIQTFSCIFLDSWDILNIKGALSLSIHLASYGLHKQRVPLKSHYLGKSAVSLTIPLEHTTPLELIQARCIQVHKISASRKQFLQQQKAIHPPICQVAIGRAKEPGENVNFPTD